MARHKVLLVEDNQTDIMIFERAARKVGLDADLTVMLDGRAALDYLHGLHADAPDDMPSIILLDLNMPRMNGFDFLESLRADPVLKDQVVFVLTTSTAPSDVKRSYDYQVAGYLTKDTTFDPFLEKLELLRRYLEAVKLSPRMAGTE